MTTRDRLRGALTRVGWLLVAGDLEAENAARQLLDLVDGPLSDSVPGAALVDQAFHRRLVDAADVLERHGDQDGAGRIREALSNV